MSRKKADESALGKTTAKNVADYLVGTRESNAGLFLSA